MRIEVHTPCPRPQPQRPSPSSSPSPSPVPAQYISGEDPHLGSVLVGPVVRGIQAQGVIANAKHWVNNNQETQVLLVCTNKITF